MNRTIFAAAVAVVMTFSQGCAQQEDGVVKREGEPDYVTQFDDAAMDKAIAEAKVTHTQFVEALANPGENRDSFAVKRGFRVGDEPYGEHIWISEVTFDGTNFQGVVNNEPVDTTEVKLGDTVTVTSEQLSDWMYVEDGVLRGGYTIRVLLKGSSPEQLEAFSKNAGFRIE
jgi:uncharacterized protein YegJ (DUF2314 family)